LERVKKKLEETTTTIDDAAHRSRQLEKRLKKVEALPVDDSDLMNGELHLLKTECQPLKTDVQ
jgi:DNA recombination protein RmuC